MFRRLIPILLLAAAGCASQLPKDSGFGEVQSDVSARTGRQIQWNRNSSDAAAMTQRVDAMLRNPISADDAVQIALLNNHRLQAMYEQLGIAQAQVMQASMLPNPALEGDVKIPEGGAGTHIELSLVANFIDLLYLPARKSIAQSEWRKTKSRITWQVLDVASQTQRTFYSLLAAQQTLEMRRTAAEATDASFELAQRINQAGNSTALELAHEQSADEEAKLNLLSAQADADDWRERLVSLLGLESPNRLKIQPKLPEIPANEMEAAEVEKMALEHSLDLAMARDQMELAKKQLRISEPMGMFSGAQVGAAYKRETDGTDELGPAFSLPIPLFNQGQPAIAKAAAQLRAARENYQALQIEIRSAARAAMNRMMIARQRAQTFANVLLPLHQRIVDETQKQVNAMTMGGFALLDARQMQLEAGANYIAAQRDYLLAKVQLDQILAGRMPASQDNSNEAGE
jgi:cobalt-zinc-cadmium efflux system outer membrane protein